MELAWSYIGATNTLAALVRSILLDIGPSCDHRKVLETSHVLITYSYTHPSQTERLLLSHGNYIMTSQALSQSQPLHWPTNLHSYPSRIQERGQRTPSHTKPCPTLGPSRFQFTSYTIFCTHCNTMSGSLKRQILTR